MDINIDPDRIWTKTEHGKAELFYRINDKVMSLYHTFTPLEDRSKGIAAELAKKAFEIARQKGLKVSPDCPYIVLFVDKHKEYAADVV